MDIFLPVDSEIMVKLGEQVRANVHRFGPIARSQIARKSND